MNTTGIEKQVADARVEYESMAETIETDVLLDNEKLKEAGKKQVRIQIGWEMMSSKMKNIVDDAKVNTDRALSTAYKDAISDGYKSYSATDAKNIAMCDEKYIEAKIVENKALRLRRDVDAIMNAIETRKYVLKDIVSMVNNDNQNHII